MTPRGKLTRGQRVVLVLFFVFLVVPGAIGFVNKLYHFIRGIQHPSEGGFTIVPVFNYLFVSAGMFFLLIWAIAHGMFRNIEEPKYTMLDRERMLDRAEGFEWE